MQRCGGARADRVLGRRLAGLPLDRDHLEPVLAGQPATAYAASGLHLRGARDVRRDDRDVGVEVPLQPAAAERARPQAADGAAGARQPVVSVRTRGSRAGCGGGARVLSSRRSAVVSGDGRTGRLVARAGGRSVPERLRRRPRARAQGRRAGDREGEGRRVGRRLDGSVPTGPCNWIGTNPGNVDRRELDAAAADVAEPVPAAGAARCDSRAGAGRNGGRPQLPARHRS